jgi:hypothetical protein
MGQLVKCSVKGVKIKSLECQLLSWSTGSTVSREGVSNSSLWEFSGDSASQNPDQEFEKMQPFLGKFVWVHYEQRAAPPSGGFFSARLRDTDYVVKEIGLVTREIQGRSEATCDAKVPENNLDSTGVRYGRIVKSSTKGSVYKTWELTVQLGDQGNTLTNMSMSDAKLYVFAIEALKTGKPLLIHYVQESSKSSWNDSDYIIDGIKFLEDSVRP